MRNVRIDASPLNALIAAGSVMNTSWTRSSAADSSPTSLRANVRTRAISGGVRVCRGGCIEQRAEAAAELDDHRREVQSHLGGCRKGSTAIPKVTSIRRRRSLFGRDREPV